MIIFSDNFVHEKPFLIKNIYAKKYVFAEKLKSAILSSNSQ